VGLKTFFPVRGIEIPRGFQSSPKGDSRRFLHLFPPLKRRAIARRPAQAGLEQYSARVVAPSEGFPPRNGEIFCVLGIETRAVSSRPLKGTLSSTQRFPAVETAGYYQTSR
jgi:hypothetical protein